MTVVHLHPDTTAQPTYQSACEALEANLGLIEKASRSVNVPEQDREDAYQEAALAFMANYDGYNPARATLSTYMWPYLRGAVLHYVRSQVRHSRARATSDDSILDGEEGGDGLGFLDLDVERFLFGLDPDDRRLLVRLHWADESASQIARSLGVRRQTVHARHRRLLERGRSTISVLSISA